MREESRECLRAAFERDCQRNGASLIRSIDTLWRGYQHGRGRADPRVKRRAQSLVLTFPMRYFLPASRLLATYGVTTGLAARLESEYQTLFGPEG